MTASSGSACRTGGASCASGCARTMSAVDAERRKCVCSGVSAEVKDVVQPEIYVVMKLQSLSLSLTLLVFFVWE